MCLTIREILENEIGDKEGGVEEKEVGVGRKKGWSMGEVGIR